MLTLNRRQDPMIRKRSLQLLVYFSTTALNKNTDVMLKVLEHILLTWPALEPKYRSFNDAVKDLQGESMIELQRLAADMPDHLLVCSVRIRCVSASNIHASRMFTAKSRCG